MEAGWLPEGISGSRAGRLFVVLTVAAWILVLFSVFVASQAPVSGRVSMRMSRMPEAASSAESGGAAGGPGVPAPPGEVGTSAPDGAGPVARAGRYGGQREEHFPALVGLQPKVEFCPDQRCEVPATVCRPLMAVPCASGARGRPAVAVFVAGLRQRLLFNTTARNVLGALAKEGFAVHFYLSLVDKGAGHAFRQVRSMGHEDPTLTSLTHQELCEVFYKRVASFNACHVCCSVSSTSEELWKLPTGYPFDQRMLQYRPQENSLGRNVLRVWMAREGLWNAAKKTEEALGFRYQLAMWTRDDAVWPEPIVKVAPLLRTPNASLTVWSKNCKVWFGINDKNVLMGREAAEVMFSVYSKWFTPTPNLEVKNAEAYLKAFGRVNGLLMSLLEAEDLSGSDGMLYEVDPPKMCLLSFYWCASKPPPGYEFCEVLFPRLKGQNIP